MLKIKRECLYVCTCITRGMEGLGTEGFRNGEVMKKCIGGGGGELGSRHHRVHIGVEEK